MAESNEVDLDSVIDRLLEVRGSRPGKQVQLLEAEIRYLCTKAREIFISQPILLELEAPIKVGHPTTSSLATRALTWADLWRHSRPILRPSPTVRVRRFPTRSQLSVPGRLRGSRKTVFGNHLPPPRVQDQVPRKLFHPTRQPRVREHQSNLRILR